MHTIATFFKTLRDAWFGEPFQGAVETEYDKTSRPEFIAKTKSKKKLPEMTLKVAKNNAMHFLGGHCCSTWDGSSRSVQTFFAPDMGPHEVMQHLNAFIKEYWREINVCARKANGGFYKFTRWYKNCVYSIYARNNHVKTFFPVVE